MSVLTFFTAFALVLRGTAANVILELVIAAPAVLTGTGVTLVGVCKNTQCQSGSRQERRQQEQLCGCWKRRSAPTGIDVPELFLEDKDVRFD